MAFALISLETLALIFIILFAVKLIVLLIKPKSWLNVVEAVYKIPALTVIVFLVLDYFILDALLSSGMTFVQIFAVALFVALLAGMTFAVYAKDVIVVGSKLLKDKKFWRKAWLPVLVWVLLAVLALNEMFNFW